MPSSIPGGAPLPLKASFAFLDLVFSRTSSSILPGKFFQHRSHFALAKTSPFPHFFSVFHHSNIWFFLHLLTRPSKLRHTKCFVPLGRSTDTQIVTESVQPRGGSFLRQRGLFSTFGKTRGNTNCYRTARPKRTVLYFWEGQ